MDDEISDEPIWDCVACNKRFLSEAAWFNHERSKKHKKEVERLKREMLEEDLELAEEIDEMEPSMTELNIHDTVEENVSASRKKDKKKKKQQMKMQAAVEEPDPPTPPDFAFSKEKERMENLGKMLPHLAQLDRKSVV